MSVAWLQKHPTPAAMDGCFHWYPADGDRELRARLVERMRGVEPPAALFELGGGVAWAIVFAATSPVDRRHYTGLALACGASPAELAVPAAAPYALAEAGVAVDTLASLVAAPVPPAIAREELAAIATGLVRGGAIAVADPTSPRLPAAFADVLAQLPDPQRPRTGCVRAGASHGDALGALVAGAICEPRGTAARTWAMLRELAVLRGATLDGVLAGSRGAADPVRELHDWGRGRGADVDALADALALRIVDAAMTGRDPYVPIAAARWHALLPAAHRDALFAALAARGGATIAALVEASHA